MKNIIILGFILLSAQILFGATAQATEIGACSKEQLATYYSDYNEVEVHRKFTLPFISYPFGTKISGGYGFYLKLRVSENGDVTCYELDDSLVAKEWFNPRRKDFLKNLKTWHYTPFIRDGKAVEITLEEYINEQEHPKKQLPLPNIPIEQIHITLERGQCHQGSCPIYKIEIFGDGRVIYNGDKYVDVEGTYNYRVSTKEVAQLVESLRTSDIWSLRPAYILSDASGAPWHALTIKMGKQQHRLVDHFGASLGMPRTVSDFQDEVDKVARSNQWISLSQDAIEFLKADGYDFSSPAAGAMLARSVANSLNHDDEAMLSLIALGAPIDHTIPISMSFAVIESSVIEVALLNQRTPLIDPLIAKGALTTNGRPDQDKIDAAFRAAIRGGRLALVQKIWDVAGDERRPALTFDDRANEGGKTNRKQSPVTLLLSHHFAVQKGRWEGSAIAKWLAERGCDIKAASADGTTLLHIAAEGSDADFVRYLLSKGLDIDASTLGSYGMSALKITSDEKTALILLNAGANLKQLGDSGEERRRNAKERHWPQVEAWLKAHDR